MVYGMKWTCKYIRTTAFINQTYKYGTVLIVITHCASASNQKVSEYKKQEGRNNPKQWDMA